MKKLLLLLLLAITPILQAQENSCMDAENATHITGPGTFTVGDINGDPQPIVCAGVGVASNGEWFAYSPTSGVNATFSSDLSTNGDKDTRFQVYIGDCGSLTCYGGDDDDGIFQGSNSSSLLATDTFVALPGETYYIVWDNRYTGGDNFTFEVTETPLPPISFESESFTSNGSRRALVDMNGDFLDDIVSIPQNTNSPPQAIGVSVYYQQVGGGFSSENNFPITPTYNPSWSLAVGDYDANGYNDLVFGSTTGVSVVKSNASGTAYSIAYSNTNVFTQRTNFVDINNDGDLDVFVCHDQAPNVYYINDGSNNLDFFQGPDPLGVPGGLGDYPSGGDYGSIWVDYDNDHDMDLFIAKCGGEPARRTDLLYRNDSANGNASFTEIGDSIGIADEMQTWSSAWADFDNDGDMDLFVGSYSTLDEHKLMKNRLGETLGMGEKLFQDVSVASGVENLSKTGVENAAHDFNNDGYIDIISNGKILINNGDFTFTEETSVSLPTSYAIGDLNKDGYLDLYGSQLYYNVTNTYISNNWLKVNTVGVQSNKNGIGARVEINSSGIGTQIRDVRSGDGFRFMGSLNTHFGIGADTSINSLTIYWPSGAIDIIINPTINSTIKVVEGETLGSQNTTVSDMILYPNPTKNVLNINTNLDLSKSIYAVFDLTGKRILNAKLESNTINVSHLASGNYILRIVSGNKIRTQKFIKQ